MFDSVVFIVVMYINAKGSRSEFTGAFNFNEFVDQNTASSGQRIELNYDAVDMLWRDMCDRIIKTNWLWFVYKTVSGQIRLYNNTEQYVFNYFVH